MLRALFAALVFGAALMLAPLASGQAAPPADVAAAAPKARSTEAPAANSSEIVVLGDVPVDQLPTQTTRLTGQDAGNRSMGADASFFVRCAKLPRTAGELRNIIDRNPRDSIAEKALHRYISKSHACYPGYPTSAPYPQSPFYGDCNAQANGVCRTTFDRGALYEAALRKYADGFSLTRKQTFDPAVRARFMRRENERNQGRLSHDMDYFLTVACMVQIAPQYGFALLEADRGSAAETAARQYLIGNGGPCVSGAKQVKADPNQFRAYDAEAVYAWIVATKGVRTLVR